MNRPIDRLPPHSPEAEQAVLGCILLDPPASMGDCISKFKPGSDVFYDLRHGTIYSNLVELYDGKEGIDVITLQQRLKDKQLLEQCGGISYLAALPDTTPSPANLGYYADIVLEKYLLRKMLHACTDAVGSIYESDGDVDALLDKVESDVLKVRESCVSQKEVTFKDLIRGAVESIEDSHQKRGVLTGIGSGFTDFDKLTSGLQNGEMIVIAARPSMGKTSLAMNIAEHVAAELGLPVGVFSLEMTAAALALRMLCSRARCSLQNIRDGFLAERDMVKITASSAKLSKAPMFIDDTGGLSILQLRARARRMAQQYGIKLLVIDYIQLLHSTNRKADNRQTEIADISSGVKSLAKELNVPVMVLSQLNRDLEKDKARKPRMSDLRESGAIEQDADLVGLLYKPSKEDEDGEGAHQDSEAVNLLIAKQRNGPTGDVALTFLRNYTRFESAAKVSSDDYVDQQGSLV